MNTTEGFLVFQIDEIAEHFRCISRLKHDTSREDPTLVADVLREVHDPEKTHNLIYWSFLAFYASLDDAIDAIDAHEARFGWQRQHIRDCKKAVETAKRNLYSAEQSQRHTALVKLDCFKGATTNRLLAPVEVCPSKLKRK